MTTNGNMRQTSNNAARSPGKLILSGEHSVVYGAPALVAAVNRYTEVWFTPIHRSRTLQTAFDNLSKGEIYPLETIGKIRQKLDERFEDFAQGKLPVQQILQRPDDLAIYTLARVMQAFPVPGVSANRNLPVPGRLSSKSDLPLGAGMGSSAAIIAATLVLYEHFLGKNPDNKKRFEWVRFCERLQHGKGSAVDAAAVIYGGLNRVMQDEITPIGNQENHPFSLDENWYWVLTGIPSVSTGECVATVRRNFGDDAALWHSFTDCTNALEQALRQNDDCSDAVRENHRLLDHIGVVTDPVRHFIQSVETAGGAAKISGAGAIKGDNSGAVLVYLKDREVMKRLMANRPNWQYNSLSVAEQGAHLFQRQLTELELEEQKKLGQGNIDAPVTAS